MLAGTPPYMAPEQMQGADADARSDLFAFGATLYEMLAGTQAFEAGPDGDVQAAILEREPAPLSERAPLAPPALARIVATCLAKDRDERWQTAKDLLRELRWVKADLAAHAPALAGAGAVSRRGVVMAATMAVAVLGTAAVAVMRSSPAAPARVSFVVPPPEGTRFPRGTIDMAVSPDGSRLVFGAMSADGTWRLWLRRFEAVESHAITGSEGARFPFWSPDGRWIGFFSGGKLKRIPEAGGLAQDICDVRKPVGGAWSPDGTILFGVFEGTLLRVPASGGLPAQVTALDASRGAPHPRLAGVPAGWPTLPVSGVQQRSCAGGGLSGHAGCDGHSPGRGRRIPCRGVGRTPSVAQQGSAGRPAVRPGEWASRRRVDHNRRPHRVRYTAARRQRLRGR